MGMLALFGAEASAASGPYVDCPGCLEHPLHDCAACGAPAVVALPAGEHAMSLCRACVHLLVELRREVKTDAQVAARKGAADRKAAAKRTAVAAPAAAKASPAKSGKQSRSRRSKVAAA